MDVTTLLRVKILCEGLIPTNTVLRAVIDLRLDLQAVFRGASALASKPDSLTAVTQLRAGMARLQLATVPEMGDPAAAEDVAHSESKTATGSECTAPAAASPPSTDAAPSAVPSHSSALDTAGEPSSGGVGTQQGGDPVRAGFQTLLQSFIEPMTHRHGCTFTHSFYVLEFTG